MGVDEQRIENLIPELKKKDVQKMQPDKRDQLLENSEQVTIDWIHAFLDETYRIDDFFKNKQTELINSFIDLQDKFRIRTEKYESNSQQVEKSKLSKKSSHSPDFIEENSESLLVQNSANVDPISPSAVATAGTGMSKKRPGLQSYEALLDDKTELNISAS